MKLKDAGFQDRLRADAEVHEACEGTDRKGQDWSEGHDADRRCEGIRCSSSQDGG